MSAPVAAPLKRLSHELSGRWFITPHAVYRYRERVPGKRGLSYEQALGELIALSRVAHFVKTLASGFELWRGGKPHRLRYRVSRELPGMPQLVTVLRGCDEGWQR